MDLLREVARDLVRRKANSSVVVERLHAAVMEKAPAMPPHFKTPAQVARFKRAQREFDQVLLELALTSPQEIQTRNSLASPNYSLRIVNFDQESSTSPIFHKPAARTLAMS